MKLFKTYNMQIIAANLLLSVRFQITQWYDC